MFYLHNTSLLFSYSVLIFVGVFKNVVLFFQGLLVLFDLIRYASPGRSRHKTKDTKVNGLELAPDFYNSPFKVFVKYSKFKVR